MSRPCAFARAEEARQAGWVSRRYRSSGERDVAVMAFEAEKKKIRLAAEARAEANLKRTPQQRLQWLNDNNFRAVRERARLEAMIAKG